MSSSWKVSDMFSINVEVLKVEGEIPENLTTDFEVWLINKGMELGIGEHHEYYAVDEDYKNDIGVHFKVTTNK